MVIRNTATVRLDRSIQPATVLRTVPDGWTTENVFNLTWTNPADLSGIVGAFYKLDAVPTSNTDGTYVAGAAIASITGITVSGDGYHILYLWLRDFAGNINFIEYSSILLQVDRTIEAPINPLASPAGSTSINSFSFAWTNPMDFSGIVGVYYKLDAPPTSNTNGTYVAGIGIHALSGIIVSGNGTHSVYIWLVDARGNVDFTHCQNTTLHLNLETPGNTNPGSLETILVAACVGGVVVVVAVVAQRVRRKKGRKDLTLSNEGTLSTRGAQPPTKPDSPKGDGTPSKKEGNTSVPLK